MKYIYKHGNQYWYQRAIPAKLTKILGKKTIKIKNINLICEEKELDKDIFCKVRSTGKLLDAKVNVNKDLTGEVSLKIPEDGISPGQACVFYAKDQVGYKVLGGGWIQE